MKRQQVPACIRAEADARMIDRLRKEVQRSRDVLNVRADRWSAAGNPVRAGILLILHTERELCPCDISDILGMSVPAVSQHLKRMREAGLITGRREGVMIFYSLGREGRPLAKEVTKAVELDNAAN